MPQPYPGQQWTHGWKPLTPGAAKSKNHGRKPGAGSLLARVVGEAAEVHNRMKAEDAKRPGKPEGKRSPGKPSNAAPGIAYKVTGSNPVSKDRGPSAKQDKPSAKPDIGSRVDDAIRTMAGRPSKKNDNNKAKPATSKADAPKAQKKASAKPAASKPAAKHKPKNDRDNGKSSGKQYTNAEVESAVIDGLNSLPRGGHRWNTMTALREKLAGIPREQQDEVLRKMMLAAKVDIEPVAILGDLKPKDHDAAIIIGSTPNHQIRLAG